MILERYSVGELLGVDEERGRIGGVDGGKGDGDLGGGIGGRVGGRSEKGVLERLKRGLGKLVDCFDFGAVIDKGRFWEVVESELGVPEVKFPEKKTEKGVQ